VSWKNRIKVTTVSDQPPTYVFFHTGGNGVSEIRDGEVVDYYGADLTGEEPYHPIAYSSYYASLNDTQIVLENYLHNLETDEWIEYFYVWDLESDQVIDIWPVDPLGLDSGFDALTLGSGYAAWSIARDPWTFGADIDFWRRDLVTKEIEATTLTVPHNRSFSNAFASIIGGRTYIFIYGFDDNFSGSVDIFVYEWMHSGEVVDVCTGSTASGGWVGAPRVVEVQFVANLDGYYYQPVSFSPSMLKFRIDDIGNPQTLSLPEDATFGVAYRPATDRVVYFYAVDATNREIRCADRVSGSIIWAYAYEGGGSVGPYYDRNVYSIWLNTVDRYIELDLDTGEVLIDTNTFDTGGNMFLVGTLEPTEGNRIEKLAKEYGVVGFVADRPPPPSPPPSGGVASPWGVGTPPQVSVITVVFMGDDGEAHVVSYLASTPSGTVLYSDGGAQYIVP
jgi:hypothetical protein